MPRTLAAAQKKISSGDEARCSGFSLPRTASRMPSQRTHVSAKKRQNPSKTAKMDYFYVFSAQNGRFSAFFTQIGCFSGIFGTKRARLAVRGRLKPEQRTARLTPGQHFVSTACERAKKISSGMRLVVQALACRARRAVCRVSART
ncbi:MAG: hypothetical protein EOM20_17675 [Spartobacteria bacterium]|nr:hypothetical protein [Spartobacteria bacterium]